MSSTWSRVGVCSASLALLFGACRTAQAPAPAPRPLAPVAAAPVPAAPAPQPAPAPASPVVTDDGHPVGVDMQVEALVGEGPAAMVGSGQRLKSGDRLAVHVTPNANAYVAVALVSSEGEPQILFPTQGPGIVGGGVVERIPAPGKWFRLDKSAGREDIYVYAAKHPLAPEDILVRVKADAEAARKAAATRRQAKGQAKGQAKVAKGGKPATSDKHGKTVAENDAPEGITADTRSLELVDETPPQSEVTKKRFSIEHEK